MKHCKKEKETRVSAAHSFLSANFCVKKTEKSYCLRRQDRRSTEPEDLWTGRLAPAEERQTLKPC